MVETVHVRPPTPRAGHVIVRVRRAAVNPTDVLLRRGGQAARLARFAPPYVLGMDLAGVVESAEASSGWAPGDPVIGVVTAWRSGGGAQAQLVEVPLRSLVRTPEGLDPAQAATILMNGLTAQLAISALGISPGDWIVVSGAAGAVGTAASELAIASGARVVGIAASSDRAWVESLGACHVARGDTAVDDAVAVAGGRFAAAVDAAIVGQRLLAAVRDGGRFAQVRPSDARAERRVEVVDVFVPAHLGDLEMLAEVARRAADHTQSCRVADVLPMSQARRAHELLERGGVRGRLVLDLD
jgi:NADPH:quinone reductase-like Zn-dependent oxidoreductase